MTAVPGSQDVDPAVRRRANRLGLALGGACLALTAVFFIIFWYNGFPKDPVEYRRQLNRKEALEGQGGSGPPPADARQGERTTEQH